MSDKNGANKNALEFRFERRRYGAAHFYCWAHVKHGDQWIGLGDPWPGVHWPKAELTQAALEAIERNADGNQ